MVFREKVFVSRIGGFRRLAKRLIPKGKKQKTPDSNLMIFGACGRRWGAARPGRFKDNAETASERDAPINPVAITKPEKKPGLEGQKQKTPETN